MRLGLYRDLLADDEFQYAARVLIHDLAIEMTCVALGHAGVANALSYMRALIQDRPERQLAAMLIHFEPAP